MHAEIREANRYLQNAKEILVEKAIRVNGHYEDPKYVKMAGHTGYSGVLVALYALIPKEYRKKRRKSVYYYQEFLTKYDKKMLNDFISIYSILHMSLGYDGVTSTEISKVGLKLAKDFIEKVDARLN